MIKGILFDKDGTLIDFSLWIDAAANTIKKLMKEYCLEDDNIFNELKKSIGIKENGAEPFGALANRSHEDVAAELHFVLSKYRNIELEPFQKHVVELIRGEVLRDEVKIKPLTDIRALYEYLNSKGIKMGLATADSYQSAMHMIDKLNLHDCFDFIGSNDGVMKLKPHKDECERFCSMYGLNPEEVAIVGDSYYDMMFAKNSGAIGVGVLSGVSCKINLKDIGDVIIPSANSLFDDEVLYSLDEESYETRELWTA
ncbi:HAD family hydrolase [Sedimentibacter sp.]|uniref:HAD family hydrolase n=1 Tax=Sedimentibacter sp. TaxID=1960295 RepID=UPI0028ACB4F1|nr:HAD family hydrolase [Sedimentibacter sp.]